MNNSAQKVSDRAYGNKIAMRLYIAITSVLLLAYLLEFIKGSRTLLYTLVFSLLCIVPVVLDLLVYKKNQESRSICYITSIGYGLMYCYAVFTTNSISTFTYIFPMFIVITLFSEMLYCVLFGAAAVLINIASVAYHFVAVGYTNEEIPDVEIRILCTLITAVYVVITTMTIRKMDNRKVEQIDEQNKKTEEYIKILRGISDNMISEINNAQGKVSALGESVKEIATAMGEVSAGSADTAESVQEQMQQTEEIQNYIVNVKDTTEIIERNMVNTSRKVEEGKGQMDALAEQVTKSMEANSHVIQQMRELTEYTRKMNTITETITNIADSTVMLSLNASIEAARAGDAGKGFAVVASEISALANQTMSATVNISELINNINQELADVEAAVDIVTMSNQANAESTRAVKEQFSGILRGTEEVENQTRELLHTVESLEDANESIVEKIQNISAITEEVSAHAGETHDSCEENSRIADETVEIVRLLTVNAEKLKNLE